MDGNRAGLLCAKRRDRFLVIDDANREAVRRIFESCQAGCSFRSQKGLQGFLDRVAACAELPRMTSKVFRRTYQTLAHLDMMAGALAQAQAGHSDPKTTGVYLHPNIEQRKRHARRMTGIVIPLRAAGAKGQSGDI